MNKNYTNDGFVPPSTTKQLKKEKFLKKVEWKKRNLLKEAKISNKAKHEPQSLINNLMMTKISDHLCKMDDVIVEKLEGLVAMYLAMSECVSSTQFMAILTLYVKTHFDKSVTKHVVDMAQTLFVTPQDSEERPQWLTMMKDALTDWRLITSNPGFEKISKVITLLVTLGIMKEAKLNIGGMTIFAASVSKSHVSAFDLVDAVVETVVFFAEGGYQCFLKGSLKPLLFSNSDVVNLEERYIEMLSLWEYARNGNLKKFVGMDEAEFDKKLHTLTNDLENAYKSCTAGAEKKILSSRWKEISLLLTEFEASRVRGGLRMAPFCFKVFGESAVGKSTFTDVTMMTLLKANGFSAGDDHVITLNPDDKHMSNMRTYVTGIKIDDYGNTKLDYVDLAPSDWLIQICNNIKRYAVMADLANKGKISIEPAVVSITTNVEDLLAHQTSNEPVSIGRRAHVHVDLKVKDEFKKFDELGNKTHMLDPLKVFKRYGDSDEIQDIWDITVREIQILGNDTGGKRIAPTFEFINKQGLTNVDIFTFLKWIIKESKQHFAVQEAVVKQQTNLAEKLPWCDRCNGPSQLCDCCEDDEEIEPQFGVRIADVIQKRANKWTDGFNRVSHVAQTRVEDFAVDTLLEKLNWFESSPFAKWTNYVPESFLKHDVVVAAMMSTGVDVIKSDVRSFSYLWLLITCFFMYLLHPFIAVPSFVVYMILYSAIVEYAKSAYYKRLQHERNVMPKLFKRIREQHVKYACGAIAGFGLVWAAVKVVKALRNSISIQGNLAPKSVAEIKQRDSEVNPWTVPEPRNPGVEVTVGQNDRMQNRIVKNQWTMSYQVNEVTRHCNAIAIETGYYIMPKHMLPKAPTTLTLKRAGYTLKTILDPSRVSTYGDLACFYMANSPDVKSLIKYFSTDYERRCVPATMVFTKRDGSIMTDRTLWTHTIGVYNGAEYFNGSYYKLTKNTFGGLCMATFFSEGVHKHILGFHLGGIPDTKQGCGMGVVQAELANMISEVKSMSIFHIDTPQASDMTGEHLGKKYSLDGDLHKKSPINYIKEDSAVVCYGNVTGRSTYNSSVIETPISKVVEEVTGVPNTWGAPKFKNPIEKNGYVDNQEWKPWYESLQYSSNPSVGFAGSMVDRACEDYLSDLYDIFQDSEEFWKEDMKPLTTVETISGVDGKRFIDAMKASTSVGYPVGGPKAPHMVFLEADEFDNVSEPKIFTEKIMSTFDDAMDSWANGKVINAIFGSALKDEPTPLNKDKVRVFQAAPVVLQMGIRKYFLPVARFLSLNPLASECAVGINSAGPEWEELTQHMAKFGKDRIIAGDYSKYDLRMPAQLTQAAFSCMREIANWTGNYSKRDLRIMDSIIYEITNPLVAFNGDLMRFLGTNPSGQNMTVYANSVVNALLHRLGFFHCYPTQESFGPAGEALRKQLGRDIRFRDVVSLATYGDDAKGSVMEGFDEFNHISFANFLAENDMKFTMPDKHSDPVAFMDDTRADFLKRKNRFDEDLGHTVGMLEEASIFKSLHSILKSKTVTPEEVAAQNIDGALREWFFHGRDVFEMRRSQMKEVARRTGMLCQTLDDDFDTRVQAWKDKYE